MELKEKELTVEHDLFILCANGPSVPGRGGMSEVFVDIPKKGFIPSYRQ